MGDRREGDASSAGHQSPPPLLFFDQTAVISAPVTLQQISAFDPRGWVSSKRTMRDGCEYYGECAIDEPHGIGIMLFKDGSGPYAAGDRYGGGWKNGQFHGEGVLITSAFTYQGGWFEGKMHGRGRINYSRTVADMVLRGISVFSPFDRTHAPLEYIGEFHQMHCRHGSGMMRYENGDVYDGSWASNHRNGKGKLVCESGEIYEGEWNKDERHGYGKIQFVDGGVFKGMMVHDKRHGEGVMLFSNGDEYYGSFANNHISGQGTMRYKNGDVYEGMWKASLRHGEGKYTLRKQGATVQGNFVKGLIHGRGFLRHPGVSTFVGEFDCGERKKGTLFWDEAAQGDRACYQGEWCGECMHGKGLLWYRNGDFYFGRFVKNARHGVGNIRYANGSEYSGDFFADMREGIGILQTNTGSIQSGLWRRDIFSEGYDGEWDGKAFNGIGRLFLRNPLATLTSKSLSSASGKGGNNQATSTASTKINAAADDAESGTNYFGLFYNGVRHGTGVLKQNGHTIVGKWENDELECEEGAWVFPSGDMYVGGFSGGTRQGPVGHLWLADGSYFSAAWSGDAPSGKGVYYAKDLKSPIYSVDDDEQKAENDRSKAEADERSGGMGVMDFVFGLFSRNVTSEECDTRTVVGFNDHYVLYGEWDAVQMPYALYKSLVSSPAVSSGRPPATIAVGMQEREGCVFFSSGVCVHTGWLHHHPRSMLPHRPDAPLYNKMRNTPGRASSMGDPKCCTLCEKPFTLFRRETVCTVCQRYSCSSCLHPIEVRAHPKIEALVRFHKGLDAFENSLTAQVPACVDCARTILLSIHFSTIWIPMSFFSEPDKEITAEGEPSSNTVVEPNCGGKSIEESQFLKKSDDSECKDSPTGDSITSAIDSLKTPVQFFKTPATPELFSPPSFDTTLQHIISDPPDPLVVYQGYTCNGIPHLYGSLWWGKNAYYLGAFEQGRLHGSGVQVMRNGERYVGEFKDDLWHGAGTYCAADGSAYEGVWKCGRLDTLQYHGEVDECCQRHGRGQSYDSGGARYNGQWQCGKRHGTGILDSANGTVYSGNFYMDRIEGEGKLVQDTSVFYGFFCNGKKHGKGMERFGECVVEGEWEDDMLSGFVRVFDRIGEEVYETTYRDGNERDDCFVPPVMAGDEQNPQCAQCGTAFSFFARRHHCRLCGNVVCNSCSLRRAVLPVHFKLEGQHRVCDYCFRRLEQRRMLCIRRYSNGELYAGCYSQRAWVSRGLFRRTDGSIVLMNNNGEPIPPLQPHAPPAAKTSSPSPSSPAATTTTTTVPLLAEGITIDAAPSRDVLRAAPASPQTEIDAFGLWWAALVSVADLHLPLEMAPGASFPFPNAPVMPPLRLFSTVGEAAALRAAMFAPAVAPPPPEEEKRKMMTTKQKSGQAAGDSDGGGSRAFVRPPARPPAGEEAAMVRMARERVERFPAPQQPADRAVVLACFQPQPLLPPTPARPQREAHEYVSWDEWGARPVLQYRAAAGAANNNANANSENARAVVEGSAGLPGEVKRIQFACSFLPPIVEDIDRAVRIAPQWRPAPLSGPVVFAIDDTPAKGVVVKQNYAEESQNIRLRLMSRSSGEPEVPPAARPVGCSMRDWSKLLARRWQALSSSSSSPSPSSLSSPSYLSSSSSPYLSSSSFLSSLPALTAADVRRHGEPDDLWLVLRGVVYDCTAFQRFHPGGAGALRALAGGDGTAAFERAHAWVSCEALLAPFAVGRIVHSDAESE